MRIAARVRARVRPLRGLAGACYARETTRGVPRSDRSWISIVGRCELRVNPELIPAARRAIAPDRESTRVIAPSSARLYQSDLRDG